MEKVTGSSPVASTSFDECPECGTELNYGYLCLECGYDADEEECDARAPQITEREREIERAVRTTQETVSQQENQTSKMSKEEEKYRRQFIVKPPRGRLGIDH